MDFSDHEKYHNYMVNLNHIYMVETLPLTEDRLMEYKHYFKVLRETFVDMRRVNLEIKDISFRAASFQAEMYMQLLENEFNLEAYLNLLKAIKFMVEYTFEEDDLDNMMSAMTM